MKRPIQRAGTAHSRQQGFNLIELMVASTIALFMLIGVANLYLSSLASEKTNSQAAEITANGRYAIEMLRRDLLHAGFRGVTWATPTTPLTTTVSTITGECLGTGFATNIRQGIWGSNDANPFSATCIASTAYSQGDVVVIRHADLANTTRVNEATAAADRTTANTTLGLAANSTSLFFRSAYERGEVFQGSQSSTLFTAFTQAPAFDYKLKVNVYYIAPYTNVGDVGTSAAPLVPSLHRVVLGAGPAMTDELVASNIENMQVRYGRLTTDLNTRFYQATGANGVITDTTANNTAATDTNPTNWDAVNSVRIWLLVRSSKPELGYVNGDTYTLGDVTAGPFNDGYRREVFTTVVQLRNI